MKKTIALFFSLGFLLTTACDKDEEPDCYVQIENKSQVSMEGVTVYIGSQKREYGDIAAGATSDKYVFTGAYVADSVVLTINQSEQKLYPNDGLINWMPIEAGATYRYQLDLNQQNFVYLDIIQLQ